LPLLRAGRLRDEFIHEAIDVAALTFPPNVSIVPIDVFKPVE
jgi:hypothetical protein